MAKFKNPLNGYVQTVTKSSAFWGCLAFGIFYFAYKGAWKHFLISTLAAVCTAGLSWLVYPFFAYSCVTHSYLERGWKQLQANKPKSMPAAGRRNQPSFDGIP
jgi:hypothetical protein